ncbi:MAG: sodium/solute symporter [Hydrogenophaga sp.]|uniref:sodium:solute symporter family transporter n=1 Tax=Hydrogenophaga sp. TaxID=1904254 RepID=UPI0016944236|nr:sodium/solute symporter [Hydrogenophaga sp.]NIM40418.1 sodium/solute symporter [Hydrogenophaga sp.]NIN25325.1 sodium/solute symporter [Hydrogenophaga sp.]NIN29892.1 sodium/solute symporter [Hydrogenophaga sp.]NIN54364.1 sodium/solute symporter [Hydrogenophaga sp.]NIO52903.1 sodium/solute symporter [Hydrogenophaga sp.]
MSPAFAFGLWDWAVVIAYLVVVLLIGAWASRGAGASGEDLFLAGRSLGCVAVGLSLFASNISSTTLIGVAGAAYSSGISVAHYELMAALVLVFMAVVTIPVFLRARVTTIPQYLERRFGPRHGPAVCRYISALTIFLSIFVDTAGSVYAGVLVLQVLVPGVPFLPACIALAVFAGLYTAAGGLRAVVYTDVLQALVLLVGAAIIGHQVFAQFDFSWAAASASVPADHLSLVRPLDDPDLPWLGVVLGLPVLGFYYWGANQYIMQRVLGARSLPHARGGALLAAALKLLPLFLMAIPAAFAFSLLPGLAQGDQVFPALIARFLPAGVAGLVVAGLIAAIMSTIDSTLNASSTLVMVDFVRAEERGWSPRRIVRAGRLATAAFVVIAALWPLVIRDFPGLFNYIQQVFSYAVPPVVAVLLLGMLWRRMDGRAALVALLVGHAGGAAVLVWRVLALRQGVDDGLPHFTIVAGLTALLCAAIAWLATVAGGRHDGEGDRPGPAIREDLLWHRADAATPARGWRDYRWQSIGLVIAVAASVWAFR